MSEILKVENLSVTFTKYTMRRSVSIPAIRSLSIAVGSGEIVTIVGASGAGKSLLSHALFGILPQNCDVSGDIYYQGQLLGKNGMNRLPREQVAFIPQSITYLDPLQKVGAQVRGGKKENRQRQIELFEFFGLPSGSGELYPHEISGGMARRIFLSAALIEEPKLIVADEPTPGLDLAAAKKVLRHFREFADNGNSVLLITHDIDLAIEISDRIAVFYGGTTIDQIAASDFKSPGTLKHPYTRALWYAMPQNGFAVTSRKETEKFMIDN